MTNKKEKLVPVFSRVLLKEIKMEDVTKSGIIIPDTAKDQLNLGVIIGIGETVDEQFCVGQKVAHGAYTAGRIEYNGEEHLIVQDEDILCIIEDVKEVESC